MLYACLFAMISPIYKTQNFNKIFRTRNIYFCFPLWSIFK